MAGKNQAALAVCAQTKVIFLFTCNRPLELERTLVWQTTFLLLNRGFYMSAHVKRVGMPSKKISNDQELIQSDPSSCPQNQKGNN